MFVETKNNNIIEMDILPEDVPGVGGAKEFVNQKTQKYLEKQQGVYKDLPKEGKKLIKIITISLTTIIILLIFSFVLYFMHTKYITNNKTIITTQDSLVKNITELKDNQKVIGDTVYKMNIKLNRMEVTLNNIDEKLK